jgi:hypothetical protein
MFKTTLAALALVLPALTQPSAALQVQLEESHGVLMVPVRINDAVTIPFVLDSGASDVSVPEDVFKTLLRTRTVTESDFREPGVFVTADGSEHSKLRFILHEVRVGDRVVKDVVASVAPDKADPLLGQSFLKAAYGTMDNTRHTLVFGNDALPCRRCCSPARPGANNQHFNAKPGLRDITYHSSVDAMGLSRAFTEGLSARREHERWFAGLSGQAKDGAAYWAGQRSLPNPSSCGTPATIEQQEWITGCLAAQQRLDPTDKRRRAEPDYRRGWNAYTDSSVDRNHWFSINKRLRR